MIDQDLAKQNVTPKVIGGFNIPRSVIENKVDVLTFLEILVRKKVITPEELDEIRAAVVAHLNVMYPELQLSYTTPESLATQAPFEAAPAAASVPITTAAPDKKTEAPPLFYQAPPPKFIK